MKSIFSISVLVALITVVSHNLIASSGKNANNSPKLEKHILIAEQEALNDMNDLKFLKEAVRSSFDQQAEVKIINAQEEIIFKGEAKTDDTKILILRSNFLQEVNGTRYYQLINK